MAKQREPRLALIPIASTEPRLAAVFDAVSGAGLPVPNLYRTLAHAPAMLEAWTALAWPLRTECDAPRGLRELVILRVAWLTGAEYEWAHHVPFALEHGITRDQLDGLPTWQEATCFDARERATLDVTDSLVVDGSVPDDQFAALTALVDEQGIVELVLTASFYVCVARVLATLDIALEPEYLTGHDPVPQKGEKP